MSSNIVEFQVLEKKVRIMGLPSDRRGEILKELIKNACMRKALYFLFSEIEFQIQETNSQTLAEADKKGWFEHKKEIIRLNEDKINPDLIKNFPVNKPIPFLFININMIMFLFTVK